MSLLAASQELEFPPGLANEIRIDTEKRLR